MLTKEKKPTITKIHIRFFCDTVSSMDLLSLQQSAALGFVIVCVTIASTCNLLFFFLVLLFADKCMPLCLAKL
jgi:hypothetical protein